MAQANVTPISLPQSDPFNTQVVKRYVFNETGNIMMATTDTTSDTIQDSVRSVFSEVSVFFAAMTKAISQTVNPYAKPNSDGSPAYYSLYNYDALEAIIDGSGYFIRVNEEDVSYTTSSWGVDFSKELIEAVLGLATGSGALGFASAMVASMGKQGVEISGQSSSRTSKVANVVFVCEYLLGMPIVSALVVTADAKTVSQQVTVGPCFKEQTSSTTMVMHKDTYMFVLPSFIKQYAGDLNNGASDPAYLNLIMKFQSYVERKPQISGVYQLIAGQDPVLVANDTLSPGNQYAVFGEYLGANVANKSALALSPAVASGKATIAITSWADSGIEFTVTNSSGAAIPGEMVQITLQDGTTVLSTPTFTIGT